MEGKEIETGLDRLVREFDKISIPEHGKFVGNRDSTFIPDSEVI